MMNSLFTPRKVEIEKRDADGIELIRGYAAVYYKPDDDMTQYMMGEMVAERIMPGAFDRVMKKDYDIRALYNHDPNMVLGRTASGTTKIGVDATGMAYQILPPSTQVASDVMNLIKRGDISGSSFSFELMGDDMGGGGAIYRKEGDMLVREIYDFKAIHDVGPVTFPAYKGTRAYMRSAEDASKEIIERIAAQDAKTLRQQQELKHIFARIVYGKHK